MEELPLYTVIIPTYNRDYIVSDAINSVLNQDYFNVQIIVVDDGSTDKTQKRLRYFGNKIECFFQENQGQSVARNLGLSKAKGKYISFLDSDDLFLPGKIKAEIKLFQNYPLADSLFSISEFFLLGEKQFATHFHNIYSKLSEITSLETLTPLWHKGNIAGTCSHVIKKSLITEYNLRFDPSLRSWEDWDFFSKIYYYGTTYVLPQIFTRVRRFPDNTRRGRHVPGMPRTIEQEKSRAILYNKVSDRLQSLLTSEKIRKYA